MIQRKQTIYLLVVVIAAIVSLSLPIAEFRSSEMGGDVTLYNLFIRPMDGAADFRACPLFLLQMLVAATSLVCIFKYKNRPLQMKLCATTCLLVVAWVAYLVVVETMLIAAPLEGSLEWTYGLPLVELLFAWLARRGVKSDERLVRAADRIR